MSCSVQCGDLFIANTNAVQLVGLKVHGDAIADAAVTLTLRDPDGDPVAGAESIDMPPIAGKPGQYEGLIAATVPLVKGARYTLHVVASKEDIGVGDWRPVRTAKERT